MRLFTALRLFWSGLVKNDEPARYKLAERASGFLYPRYKFSEYGRSFLRDESFLRWYEESEGRGNYHSLDRKFAFDQLAQLALGIPGDTAECGVFRGASSVLLCRRLAGSDKEHHLFDSFEGLSQPSCTDGAYWREGDLSASEETVRETLRDFPFVQYHRGWIPDRFPDVADRSFSFVHIDVDLYEPTRDSLAFFYERMSAGGVILSDDYGFESCPGARRAFDEFLADRPEPLVHLPTGQAFLIKQVRPE